MQAMHLAEVLIAIKSRMLKWLRTNLEIMSCDTLNMYQYEVEQTLRTMCILACFTSNLIIIYCCFTTDHNYKIAFIRSQYHSKNVQLVSINSSNTSGT